LAATVSVRPLTELCRVTLKRPGSVPGPWLVRQRMRSAPVSLLNEPVWALPRPDQEPSSFQTMTSCPASDGAARQLTLLRAAVITTSRLTIVRGFRTWPRGELELDLQQSSITRVQSAALARDGLPRATSEWCRASRVRAGRFRRRERLTRHSARRSRQ